MEKKKKTDYKNQSKSHNSQLTPKIKKKIKNKKLKPKPNKKNIVEDKKETRELPMS